MTLQRSTHKMKTSHDSLTNHTCLQRNPSTMGYGVHYIYMKTVLFTFLLSFTREKIYSVATCIIKRF